MAPKYSNSRRGHTRNCDEGSSRKRGFSKHLNPSAWVRAVHKFDSVIVTTCFWSMHIPLSIRTSNAMANIKGLVNSGATDCFISPTLIKRMKLGMQPLHKPQKIWNINNMENKAGLITHYIDLDVQTQNTHRTLRFLITNIGNKDIVLGYPWLSTFELWTTVQLGKCSDKWKATSSGYQVSKPPDTWKRTSYCTT